MKKRERLAGVYVGDMRILARCEDRELPDGRLVEQWLCRCSCGAIQKRTRSNIVRAYRYEQNMACYACRKETVGGWRQARRDARKELFLQWWKENGTLYVEHVEDEPAPNYLAEQTLCSMDPEGCSESVTQQRMTDLYPIKLPKGRVLQCCHCKKSFNLLFGCVECLEAVCINCARNELHKHPENMTLRNIGVALGKRLLDERWSYLAETREPISRERVRQIEQYALRKVRKELEHMM